MGSLWCSSVILQVAWLQMGPAKAKPYKPQHMHVCRLRIAMLAIDCGCT